MKVTIRRSKPHLWAKTSFHPVIHILNSSRCSFGDSTSLQGKEKILGGRETFFLMGQYLGGSGTHLTLIHPWLNVSNSFSTQGLLLHSDFITLLEKLRGLRDDIAIKGWRVLMPQLPWKLLVSSPARLHYFQLCSQLHIERVQEQQQSLRHFYILQREWRALSTGEKGRSASDHLEMVSAGK